MRVLVNERLSEKSDVTKAWTSTPKVKAISANCASAAVRATPISAASRTMRADHRHDHLHQRHGEGEDECEMSEFGDHGAFT